MSTDSLDGKKNYTVIDYVIIIHDSSQYLSDKNIELGLQLYKNSLDEHKINLNQHQVIGENSFVKEMSECEIFDPNIVKQIKLEQEIIKDEILDEYWIHDEDKKIKDADQLKKEHIKLEKELNTEFIIKNEMSDESDLELESEELFSYHDSIKIFSQNRYLTEYKRIDGENEEPESFTCHDCDKIFILKHQLINHLRTHSLKKPYSCNICKKKFSFQYNLTQHKRTHNSIKKFSCDQCDKTFSSVWYLITHKRCHSGEICEKNSSHKLQLLKQTNSYRSIKSIV